MKPFVVEAGTPGLRITKLEHKLGIRASDTASAVLDNCRIPLDNLLGTPEVADRTKGFKGAMATFDATRPSVAASALGIARATLELLKEQLAERGRDDPLRHAAPPAHRSRARHRGHGGAAPGGLAADAQGGLADGPAAAQHHRVLDVQGQGGRRGHADHPEGRGADGAARATRAGCCSRSGCATPRSTTSSKARARSTD